MPVNMLEAKWSHGSAPLRDTAHSAAPKIQILTVADLLAGERPLLPDLSRGERTFKSALKEERTVARDKPF